ncbi:integrin alpha pat-2-like protein [Dinothrombium tinctorium]|uniref:Integrin alpha pat-2-like protein n=1 Tax=Dinothrombium tinctorium TaxID=1965070 RepID=A0A3S3NSS1_9ACAR|nr:integrin alpha pat-2-like protein [Dinothrombium tinctorium]
MFAYDKNLPRRSRIRQNTTKRSIESDEPNLKPFQYQNDFSLNSFLRTKRHKSSSSQENANLISLEDAMSCGPTICTKIECKINNLSLGEQVVFSINSRLWKETVQEVGLEEFQISSRLVAQITRLPYNIDPRIIHKRPEIINVSTQVKLIGLVRSEPISLWIIILAICGGLLLLALLVFALWKLGFFERKRPPSAAGESEPLQSNGYNYRKGDTSL